MSTLSIVFKKARWQQDSEGLWLCLLARDRPLFPRIRRFVETMQERPYAAVLKEHRERRSLDANAYCWELIGKLAARLGIPPDDIYREAVRKVGDNTFIYPVREDAAARWKEVWQGHGLGWMCEDLGPSKLPGYVNIVNIYGSSVFDTAQMSRLIDYIIEECKEQGIETLPPEKVSLLKEGWGDLPRENTA